MISSSSNPNGYHLYMMKIFCSAWFLINFSIVMDAVGLLVQEKHGSFDKVIQTSTGSSKTGNESI
ncbi:hypothetical protein ASG99_13980 [Bacillus sp. Soil768D1]|nr:hypothetical protein ASG99_13980 [Bacillus sp. Soil768D1]